MIRKNPKKVTSATGPRYSKEEFARRGEEIYEREIRPALKGRRAEDFVLIDIETGAYEVDRDEMAAADRLAARVPDAQVWMRLVGSPFSRRFGLQRAEDYEVSSWIS